MTSTFKKILLTGTALVAASAFSVSAQAATIVSGATGTWAGAGAGTAGTHATIPQAVAGDTVNLAAAGTLTVTNDQTADDGSGDVDTFVLGAVTNTGLTGNLTITGTDNGTVLDVTVASATLGGNFALTNADGTAANNVTATVTGALTTTGNLTVANNNVAGPVATTLTLGSATIGGTTGITVGVEAGASSTVTVNGNAAFNGAVTVTGGAAAAANAALVLKGATNTFTGGLTLNTDTGLAKLTLNGAAAQTVAGVITGDGTVTVANAAGVTFTKALTSASTVVEGTDANSSATFQDDITTALKLGTDASADDVNTVTLDGTTAGFAVTGTVNGTATEIDNIIVKGGNTITTTAAWGGVVTLDSVALTGTGTTLALGASATSAAFTLASGTTLSTTAAATITGTVDGAGTLSIGDDTTVASNVGATTTVSAINVATGKTLTMGGATIKATTTTLTGTGALTLNAGAHAFTGNIAAAATGNGTVTVADNASTTSITGNIGTSTFKVGTLAIAGGAANVVTTTGDLYVNAITLNAADTLSFTGTGTQTVSGTVTGSTTAAKVLVGTGTVAFGGAVQGAVGIGAGSATFADTLTGALLFSADGSATFADTKGVSTTVGGTGGVAGTGVGNVTYTGTVAAAATTIGATGVLNTLTLAGGSSTVQKTVTTSGAVTAADTNNLNGNVLASGGAFGLGATQALNATIYGTAAANYGHATAGGAVTIAATSGVNLTVNSGVYIPTATSFIVIDDTGNNNGAPTLGATMLNVNGTAAVAGVVTAGQYTWTQTTPDNDDLVITATRVDIENVTGADANGVAVGSLLDTLAANGDAALDAAQGYIAGAGTAAALNDRLSSVSPTVDGSAVAPVLEAGAAVQGVTETRLAFLRTGEGSGSGVAAGTPTEGAGMWVQAYGQAAEQDARSGVAGYDADTIGGAIGVDTTRLLDKGTVGLAFNYGRTNADSNNANTTATEIDSYGFTVYGSTEVDQFFVNGQVGYAYNAIDTTRHNAGGVGINAYGDTHSSQYSAKMGVGKDYEVQPGVMLTPVVSAAYTHVSTASYTETGTGANLNVSPDDVNVLNLGLGGKVAWSVKAGADGSVMKPNVHAGYTYDAIGDKVQSTSNFVGDTTTGLSFATQGPSPARGQANIGAGLTFTTVDNWDLSANYDYSFKSDYKAHSGYIRALTHF